MSQDSVTITDQRTGKTYEIPVEDGAIRAMALRQIKVSENDFGLLSYDPAYSNTASCKSTITFIDGEKGILRYRGYPIEQLAEKSEFLEVCYLLEEGELPSSDQLSAYRDELTGERHVPEQLRSLYSGFKKDAHLMGMLCAALPALGTYYPDSGDVADEANRKKQIRRLIAKLPLVAADSFRYSQGKDFVDPDPNLSYAGNFLRMVFGTKGEAYEPHPAVEHAIDVLLILHADHEQNCSTSAMRNIGSSQADPYAALGGAAAALWGPLHGGANEAVLRMLKAIGTKDNIPSFIDKVKAGEGRLMGFGHRVYKNYDPRAKIIKVLADEVFEAVGVNPLLEIARELEGIALSDDYFVSRKLYPNVDFYSGLIYQALGFPVEFFPVLFAVGRAPGWLSQWNELLNDKEQKIARPRQLYLGSDERDFPRS